MEAASNCERAEWIAPDLKQGGALLRPRFTIRQGPWIERTSVRDTLGAKTGTYPITERFNLTK